MKRWKVYSSPWSPLRQLPFLLPVQLESAYKLSETTSSCKNEKRYAKRTHWTVSGAGSGFRTWPRQISAIEYQYSIRRVPFRIANVKHFYFSNQTRLGTRRWSTLSKVLRNASCWNMYRHSSCPSFSCPDNLLKHWNVNNYSKAVAVLVANCYASRLELGPNIWCFSIVQSGSLIVSWDGAMDS